MYLADSMFVHIVSQRVKISEVVRRPTLTAMVKRMYAHVIVVYEFLFQLVGKTVEGSSRICKLGVSACDCGW